MTTTRKVGLGTFVLFISMTLGAIPCFSADEGATIFGDQCVRCHNAQALKEKLKGKKFARKDWVQTNERMKKYGAKVAPDKEDVLIDYLMRTFGAEKN
jgi:hypothetical protein